MVLINLIMGKPVIVTSFFDARSATKFAGFDSEPKRNAAFIMMFLLIAIGNVLTYNWKDD
ncbi:hypothetical protein QJS04_geneDACA020090 [Acorus gramineus]|uniref:Uncharacterized protein n=1 Tax=Acorus gramineus TaxID=55184 RepID=A0AAV9A5W7_ACOGR|nr:hypothetical protein QJS04_geneDACA020090 [Acorus gramineus]